MTEGTGFDGRSAAIQVPTTPESLALVRVFASAIGRHADLPEEDVEDLTLTLTEVCSAAIEASAGADGAVTVDLGWGAGQGSLEAHVVSSTRFSTGDPRSSDRAWLLDALGLEFVGTDDGHGVAFAPLGSSS